MSAFSKALSVRTPSGRRKRRWLFVAYDQLSDGLGPLAREPADELGVVLVENPWKAARRPYHKQKLALILANLRHFALEQAERGVAVRHVVANGPYHDALAPLAEELGTLRVLRPAERELRVDLEPLVRSGKLEYLPHDGWLTTPEQFKACKGPPWRMDEFYRRVRRDSGILMESGKPAGGRFSFDGENRNAWTGDPPAPPEPSFPADPIKEEVAALIEKHYARHPGTLDLDRLPATNTDAEAAWSWAKRSALPTFGPYEDAMSERSSTLFHTRLSALLNLHRLLPARVVREAAAMDLPLASKEGFVRQVLGWREFVHHVHEATDGFRKLPGARPPLRAEPGDGGYARWSGTQWRRTSFRDEPDGGAAPSRLGADAPLPLAYWGTPSGLRCLDHVVRTVWEEGYSHHITRLMVLSNLASLLDLSPRELADWFWAAYTDAFDWVVEPNVLGMGTFAVGDLMTTKPYVSGAAYIARMSDFCEGCRFDPKSNCPITAMYWAYLERHREALRGNPRLALPLKAAAKRPLARKTRDAAVFRSVQESLAAGRAVTPESMGAGSTEDKDAGKTPRPKHRKSG